jgi:hypothetical protein
MPVKGFSLKTDLKGERDHEEGDDEEDAADDDAGGLGHLLLGLLAHVDAEQVCLQKRLPKDRKTHILMLSNCDKKPQKMLFLNKKSVSQATSPEASFLKLA